jgi:RND superfamily putative drug exporter
MMKWFAKAIVYLWPLFVVGWIALPIYLHGFAPSWDQVARGGTFDSLPPDSPSVVAKQLFEEAFPNELFSSSVVIVLYRPDEPLRQEDKHFADRELRNGLFKIAEDEGGLAGTQEPGEKRIKLRPELAEPEPEKKERSIIARIRDYYDPGAGPFLVSADKKATLVLVDLTTDVLSKRSGTTLNAIRELIAKLKFDGKIPDGLQVELTGGAVAGRELRDEEMASVKEVEKTTMILVVVLLLVIYRAPLLALIPILTVFVAVTTSVQLLALAAQQGWIHVAETTKMYIIVVNYGAGVDYCLFLTARYREELQTGMTPHQAAANALFKVGHAVIASAATVACGIAMLVFARFGRYHMAGICLPFSLCIVLLAALTFTPCLLRMCGRFAFWPYTVRIHAPDGNGRRLGWLEAFWSMVGRMLVRWPTMVWLATVLLMLPSAMLAYQVYNRWNYGLTQDVPHATSRRGAEIVSQHFSPGMAGTVIAVLRHPDLNFSSNAGIDAIEELTRKLEARKEEFRLWDVRTVARPFGISDATREYRSVLDRESAGRPELRNIIRRRAAERYVSQTGKYENHATRLEFVFDHDPLSRAGIEALVRLDQFFRDELPDELKGATIGMLGPTASLRDVADTTSGDLRRIEILVPAVVFAILVLLLWWPLTSLYLIITVIFSYLTTLGIAHLFFLWWDPHFTNLDWKVPIFLFTILVAVGEDYNIFLMTRIQEEQAHRGKVAGIIEALIATGGIISSCGFIMAGTFAALWAGNLVEMKQLGFALTFGVLLDTLVVRPLLVPAFLLMLEQIKGWFRPRGQGVMKST